MLKPETPHRGAWRTRNADNNVGINRRKTDRRVGEAADFPALGLHAMREAERLRRRAATLEAALYGCLGCLLATFPDEADSAGAPLLMRRAKGFVREALKMEAK